MNASVRVVARVTETRLRRRDETDAPRSPPRSAAARSATERERDVLDSPRREMLHGDGRRVCIDSVEVAGQGVEKEARLVQLGVADGRSCRPAGSGARADPTRGRRENRRPFPRRARRAAHRYASSYSPEYIVPVSALPTSRIRSSGTPSSPKNCDLNAKPLRTVATSPSRTRSQDSCTARREAVELRTIPPGRQLALIRRGPRSARRAGAAGRLRRPAPPAPARPTPRRACTRSRRP